MTSPETTPEAEEAGQTIYTIIAAICIALVIRMFAFEPFNIPSTSMVPGLLVGDFLFVSKYSYGYSSKSTIMGFLPIGGRIFAKSPERGDVAVFKLPRDTSIDYIKRIVGLPGDNIQVKQGIRHVNGTPVHRDKLANPIEQDRSSLKPNTTDYVETFDNGNTHIIREMGDNLSLDNTGVFTVPPDHYFAMGDNRDNSQDSRTNNVGFVPADNLVGRAEFLFFSIDEDTHFVEFWKWPTAVRWGRLFKKIR